MSEPSASHALPRREPEAPDADVPGTGLPQPDPELIERLLEEMPAGFLSVDRELRVTFVNRTAEEAWGYRREEIVGRPLWEIFPDAASPETIEAITRLATTGEPVQYETFYEPTRKWIQVFALPSGDGFSTFFLDVTERRLAEIEREEAEARYRDMVEQVPAITYLDDAFDGRGNAIFVSPQSKEILGYSPEEWRLNRDLWHTLVHPDDHDEVAAEDARCRRAGIPFEAEYRLIARDGHVVWVHDRSAPVLDESGRPRVMHGVMLDITAHHAADELVKRKDSILAAVGFAAEHLLRSEHWEDVIDEALTRLGEASGVDRVDLFELQGDGEDLRAWSRSEWCGPDTETIHERVQGAPVPWLGDWLTTLRAGHGLVATVQSGPFRFPPRLGFLSSAVAPLLIGSELWGILSMGSKTDREWSEPEVEAVAGAAAAVAAAIVRERTERHLRESEERFRRLAEEAPDIIFRHRLLPEPATEYVSPAMETVSGYTPEETLADPQLMFRMVHPDDRPLLEAMLRDPHDNHMLRWIRRDGRVVWTEQRMVKVLDEDGRLVAIEGIARDVTDRVEAERHLRESYEALRRSTVERQRLLARLVKAQEEERQRVANDIHDDSIQIMTAVGLRLAVLRNQVSTAAGEQTLANAEETVAQAIHRLRRLLFELHPMSLDNSGLAAALRDHLRLSEEAGAPEYSLVDQLGEEPSGESRTILYRIAQEALANVRKHAQARHVRIVLEPQGQGVRVTIVDDGVGFDPANIPSGGPGHVGIPSMLERANLAGGWLRVDSAPGEGTTVRYWIPKTVTPEGVTESRSVADRARAAVAGPA
jgi:PAS domain S-box-containing protein